MNLPEFLRDVEAKVYDVIRDAFHRFHTDFHSPSEQRIMAAIDTLTQNITALTDAVNALPARIAAAGNGVTDDQLNALNTAVESLLTVVNGIDPAPAS